VSHVVLLLLTLIPLDIIYIRANGSIARITKAKELDLTPLPWYVAFAYFKLAVILEGIHYRFVTGQTVGAGFDTIGQAVKPLVDGGLSVIGKD